MLETRITHEVGAYADIFCSYQPRSVAYTENAFGAGARLPTHFCVFVAQETCLDAANVIFSR